MYRRSLLLVLCVVGCAKLSPDSARVELTRDSSEDVASKSATSLERLLRTPPEPVLEILHGESIQRFPVSSAEDLASDGRRFVLFVDKSNQTAWIEVSGGIADHLNKTYGPWPLTNRVVQEFLKNLSPDLSPRPE